MITHFHIYSCTFTLHWQLGHAIDQGVLGDKWLIVGDDAFVCRNNVITPYVRKELSRAQRNYNYFLSVNRQAVERTFALWKWKWGLFWRPLLINDANIKRVIETTCRLHNLCIDVNRGGSLDDYIHHDDIFWQRLSASRQAKRCGGRACAINLDDLDFDPTYADASTIASITGHEVPSRTIRQRICQHVVDTGRQMPDVGLLVDPRRKTRVCGLRPGTTGPVRVTQVGNVQR